MLNTISIKVVYDRNKRATKALHKSPVLGLVQLSVCVNKERHFLSTGVRVFKDQFSAGRVVNRSDSKEKNAQLDEVIRQVTELVNTCNSRGQQFTWSLVDSLFYGKASKNSWVSWMENAIKERPLCVGARAHHMKVLHYLKDMGITDCSQITTETLLLIDRDLHKRMVNDKPMMATTIYTYHKVLRTYIKEAVMVGYLSDNPYQRFKCTKGHSRARTVLSMEEIDKIKAVKTTNLYLQHVRDLFLVQCYTGVAYADLDKVCGKPESLIKGQRSKTGIDFTTVLLAPVKHILERYHGKLPLMAYDCYRRMLDPLALAAGIDKHITTHVGRHTFATTIALEHGVPIEVLAKMLGHADIKTTQIYAKVRDNLVQEQAKKIAGCINI